MKRLLPSIFLLILLSFNSLFAETITVSGDVSGTWSADTVLVTGEIRVPPGETLVIEPGAKVLFQTYCKFIVDSNATLQAIGTELDSILFDEFYPDTSWHGIRFLNASDSCWLEYCHLENGYAQISGDDANGGAIYCLNTGLSILHSTIKNCTAYSYHEVWAVCAGGAIYCNSSTLTVTACEISGNSAISEPWHDYASGGGIYCVDSNFIISKSIIRENSADTGGGICCENSPSTITMNIIYLNRATIMGGGIYCHYADYSITDNTIFGNWTEEYSGGGLCMDYANGIISGNMISNGNTSCSNGGGIYCTNSQPDIINNTIFGNIAGNSGGGVACVAYSHSMIINNSIYGNLAYSCGGGIVVKLHSNPFIEENEIIGNYAVYNGGGIYCSNSDPFINKNFVSSNTAQSGGGILCYYNCVSEIINNSIVGNEASAIGGGFYSYHNSDFIFKNNIIAENSSISPGGGIVSSLSSFVISNNTIINNTADSSGGCFIIDSSNVIFNNCILWDNGAQEIVLEDGSSTEVQYCDVQGGWPGEGNISEDPIFVTGSLSDYHLSPDSPCKDAGNPDSQYNDPEDPMNPGFALWPALGTVRNDMGAYGGGGASGWLGVVEEEKSPLPTGYNLSQNYPNPFNAVTTISYSLPTDSHISLMVFNVQGCVVTQLINGWRPSGTHEISFDAEGLSSGVYIYRLEAGQFTASGKMVLMK